MVSHKIKSAGGNPMTIVTRPSATTGNQQLVFEYQGSPMTLTCPNNCQIDYDWSYYFFFGGKNSVKKKF